MQCEEARRRFDEIESGTQPTLEVAAHLMECDACRAYAHTVALLAERVSDLATPRPERDLWPEIADRIASAGPISSPLPVPRRSLPHLWPLAASLLIAAGLTLFVVSRDRGLDYAPAAEDQIHVVAWEDVIAASQERAEEVLAARSTEFPQASQVALAENLDRLDRAIREIRQAIEEHPDHPQLEILLASRIQQHARLIQRISHV